MNAPFIYQWDGESFIPHRRFQQACDKRFVVGMDYRLEEVHERSKISHDQQFAWLADAWSNLPERYRFETWAQSAEHLRKYALIRKGFCTTEQFPCSSKAEAMRLAAILRSDDQYCLVTIDGPVVNRFRAESQKVSEMRAKRFQESKQALMDFIADLLGVDPDTLKREGGRAA